MAEQNVDVALFYDGAYRSVPDEVFVAEQIRVQRGQGDEGAALRPAKVTLTFNNAGDKWRPTNPMSALYGKAGRNTPLQVAVDGTTLATVEATSWSPDRTLKAAPPSLEHPNGQGRSSVDLEAYGLLGRIAQWSDPLKSPFYRYNYATFGPDGTDTLVGYFPLEDPRASRTLFSPVPGTVTQTVRNASFQSAERPAGSDPLTDLGTSGILGGTFARTGLANSGFQVSWTMRYDELPGTGLYGIVNFITSTGAGYELLFENGTGLYMQVGISGGATLVSSGFSFGDTDFTNWTMFRIKVTESGGTVSVETAWVSEADPDTVAGVTHTYAGTTGYLQSWGLTHGSGSDSGSGVVYGHLLGLSTGASDLLSVNRIDAFLGHPAEPAGTRFLRLLTEVGLTGSLLGSAADTWPMGPQRGDTLLNLLQEIARTEDALIFDDADVIGLVMRTRRDRYNQTPALELTFGLDVAAPFNEILDDLDTHNRIVMAQRDGGQYETALTTGTMSTAAPPNGVGEYRQQVDVDVDDEANDLPALGGWWLNRGTLARSRYASVTVDLVANPEHAAACNTLEIGDLITVAGYEPDTIPLIVIGFVKVIGSHTRKITFTTVPADLFEPGVYDTARYDSGSTTTGAAYSPATASIVFSTTSSGDVWSTTATPYDCVCAGERFTVTAMGAVSGSGPYLQTATVIRGVNGIRKTLPAGEPIHTATPGRYGL